MASFSRRLAAFGAAAAAVPLLAALPIGPAEAAPVALKVNIYPTIFNPANKTIEKNSTVQYVNKSGGVVVITYSNNWPGQPGPETLADNAQTAPRKLTSVGTYTVSGALGSSGTSTVKVVAAGPTASATPRPHTTFPTAPPPSPQPTSTKSSAPAQPTPSSGSTSTPSAGATSTPAPQSSSGGAQPSDAPTSDPPALSGRSKTALIQPHAIRRLGLPGALSAVLVLGLLFGLGRVLLAIAPRRPQAD